MSSSRNIHSIFFILLITCILAINKTNAQRIKYKNLFPLLQSRNYASVEKDLLIYLSSNKDEANPYFYLGEIYTAKLDSTSIFPKAKEYDSLATEAIEAYKIAKSLVDEKEVKKNDEYYMAYNRRDLRTGKFGIKVSDVHLDYENKITALEKKMGLIDNILSLKDSLENEYLELKKLVQNTFDQYPDQQAFLWRSENGHQMFYQELSTNISSFEDLLSTYQNKLEQLNHPKHSLEVKNEPIIKWGGVIDDSIDISSGEFKYQGYENYFKLLQQELNERIMPLKSAVLISDDSLELAIQQNQVAADSSMLLYIDLENTTLSKLSEFPSVKLVSLVLDYKKQKSKIKILENPFLFPLLQDSANVYYRASSINNLLDEYQNAEKKYLNMDAELSERKKEDLAFYLNTFNPSFSEWMILEETINSKRIDELTTLNNNLQNKIQFFMLEADTVYMPDFYDQNSKNYSPLIIEKDTSLYTVSVVNDKLVICDLGYNMELNDYKFMGEVDSINSFIDIAEGLVLNTFSVDSVDTESDSVTFNSVVKLINYQDLKPKWSFNYSTNEKVNTVKVQAGIFFLYNEEEEIFLTLNAKGERIGN